MNPSSINVETAYGRRQTMLEQRSKAEARNQGIKDLVWTGVYCLAILATFLAGAIAWMHTHTGTYYGG